MPVLVDDIAQKMSAGVAKITSTRVPKQRHQPALDIQRLFVGTNVKRT